MSRLIYHSEEGYDRGKSPFDRAIRETADLMGHESMETTRKYLDHDEEALRSAQREFSPDFSVES